MLSVGANAPAVNPFKSTVAGVSHPNSLIFASTETAVAAAVSTVASSTTGASVSSANSAGASVATATSEPSLNSAAVSYTHLSNIYQ